MIILALFILSSLLGQAASSSPLSSPSSSSSLNCPSSRIIITAFILPPYVALNDSRNAYGIAYDFINSGIKKCFRSCNVPPVVWNFVNTTSALSKAVKAKSTDLALPIVPSVEQMIEDEEDLNDTSSDNASYVFEHLVESPGLSLIVHTGNFNRKSRGHILKAMLDVWPVVVFCLLLAGISGILVWAMEYKGNRSQFPKNFFTGSYEGFWWAFVTMTTVGYGDKTPKSICGRLFGVIWILVGLVIIAVFTASATTALNAGMSYYQSGIQGKRIGVFQFSEAGSVAVRNGAIAIEYTDFERMHKKLNDDQLDGLLIDRYEASHLLHEWHEDSLRVLENVDTMLHYKMVRVVGRSNALGTNKCFQGRIERHARLAQKYIGLYVKPVRGFNIAEHATSLFSANASSTKTGAAILCGTFLALVIVGSIYQFIYRRWIAPKRRKSQRPPQDQMIHLQSIVVKELGESVKMLSQDIDVLKEKLEKMQAEKNSLQNNKSYLDRDRII